MKLSLTRTRGKRLIVRGKSTHCQLNLPVIPSLRRSLRLRCLEGSDGLAGSSFGLLDGGPLPPPAPPENNAITSSSSHRSSTVSVCTRHKSCATNAVHGVRQSLGRWSSEHHRGTRREHEESRGRSREISSISASRSRRTIEFTICSANYIFRDSGRSLEMYRTEMETDESTL